MNPSDMTWALPAPVLLPLISAGLALLLQRKPRLQQAVALLAMTASLGFGVLLLAGAARKPMVLDVGSWAAPIGVTLVADQLAALMLVVSQVVTLGVMAYSVAQNVVDDSPTSSVAIFYPTFLVLSAGVSDSFLTGDLFNLYVGFEILLAASFVLITLGATPGRVRAGTTYVVVSLLSSALFLTAIAWIYGLAGTVNMAQLAVRLAELPAEATMPCQVLLLVAFGIKAAVFPLGAWLPDSYPTAPAPVTAVFAGLLTKVGIYAIIRLEFVLFPGERLGLALGLVAIVTMLTGILGAIAQDDAKRLLSYTLVSHIGYMLWGISLGTVMGLAAAIYYACHHILVQATLFLIVGLIERRAGTTSLTRLANLAKRAPLLAAMFFVTALNLVGIPPMTGFIGKLALAESSAQSATALAWGLLAAGLVTSFLTLYVAVKFWNKAFWQPRDLVKTKRGSHEGGTRHRRREAILKHASEKTRRVEAVVETAKTERERGRSNTGALLYAVAGTLVVAQLAMAAFSGPIFHYAHQASAFLHAPGAYSRAVLVDSGRGEGDSNNELEDLDLPEVGGSEGGEQ